MYSLRRAPLVLKISPGEHVLHTIGVHLIRDLRVSGGNDRDIEVQLEIKAVHPGVELVEDSLLISDLVDGKLSNDLGSVLLRNNAETPAIIMCDKLSVNVSLPVVFIRGETFDTLCQ